MKLRDKQILQIALPSIVSNITVPLLGLIDVAIVGHLGSPAYIGAIAVGWDAVQYHLLDFRFPAHGDQRNDFTSIRKTGFAGSCTPISALRRHRAGCRVLPHSIASPHQTRRIPADSSYRRGQRDGNALFPHLHLGAPAMLGLYGLTGWFIGMQNSRIPMYIAITQNIVNIIASLCLVYLCGMKVEGVALGTLIAQYAGFLIGLMLWIRNYGKLQRYWEIKNYKLEIKGEERKGIWEKETMLKFFQVNRDIFSAHPLPGGGYSVLYFSRSLAGRNHFGCQHAADAALHFVLVCNGWFCLRRRGPERQIHRRTQPGSLYRHRPTSLWMGSGNGSSLYVDLCTGR